MKLYSYVVARDYGFAPNPFFGVCTLATCKPRIREHAQVGDWVVGTGSKRYGLGGHLVYAMRVAETLSYDEYWGDPRFRQKRPNLRGSLKQAFGDNIYHRSPKSGKWVQENSHHSMSNGEPNPANIEHDTQAPRVLVAAEFVYWGGEGPQIPSRFRSRGHADICCQHPGYKCNFPVSLIQSFVSWIQSLGMIGYIGKPSEFPD
jgi:hypothetical protein